MVHLISGKRLACLLLVAGLVSGLYLEQGHCASEQLEIYDPDSEQIYFSKSTTPLSSADLDASKETQQIQKQLKPDLDKLIEQMQNDQPERVRLEAVKQLRKIKMEPIPAKVSHNLYAKTLADESEGVRDEAAKVIRDLDDQTAKSLVLKAMVSPKHHQKFGKNAARAIRTFDDPKIIEAIVTLVTTEVHAGTADTVNIDTVFIKTPEPGVDEDVGAHNALLNNPIRLPIELPTLELRHIDAVLTYYGLIGLREISGRNFGGDKASWKKWFENWKHMRAIRRGE